MAVMRLTTHCEFLPGSCHTARPALIDCKDCLRCKMCPPAHVKVTYVTSFGLAAEAGNARTRQQNKP